MNDLPTLEPGYYFGYPEATYHRLPYLSSSAIRDLEVSDMDAWTRAPWQQQDEDRDDRRCLVLGSARHALILEGENVCRSRYAKSLTPVDVDGCLNTADDLKAWLREAKEQGHKVKLTGTKDVLEKQILAIDKNAPVFSHFFALHAASNRGKTLMHPDDWETMWTQHELFGGEYGVPRDCPGGAEVTLIWDDPKLGTRCKARLDYLTANGIYDVKNFNNSRGRELDQCVVSDFCYKGLHVQGSFYLRALRHTPKTVFGESDLDPNLIRDADAMFLPVTFIFVQTDTPNIVPVEYHALEPNGEYTDLGAFADTTITNSARKWVRNMETYGMEKPWNPVRESAPLKMELVPLSFLS